jgi:tetratricopeptide (TPR) repeat protein
LAEVDSSKAAKSAYSRLASAARSTDQKTKPDFAAFAYCEGLLLQAHAEYAEAMVKFSLAIDKNPEEPRFYVALARVYEEKKVFALAKENLLSALALDSTSAGSHFELARVQMDLKEYSEALGHFKAARNIDPDFPNVNYQIGRLYFYAEKYEQAVEELQIALQKAKEDNFFLLSLYGQSLRAIRRLEDAQGYLEKAYSLKPTELSTARALAANSFDLKKYDRAIDVLKLITAPSEAGQADYSLLGESYYNMAAKDANSQVFYDSASVYLKKGYELNPENSRLAYLLGMTYFSSDQYDSALAYFSKKIQVDSTSSSAYFYLGYCYLKKEMYQDAITNLRHANQLDSTRASVHMMLAQTLIFVDSTKAAKQEFLTAIELDPAQGDAYGGLGFICLKEQNWSSAAANLKRAIELQPTNAGYWVAYGQASYYLEDYDTAERAFRRALQCDPNSKDARTGLDTTEKVKSRKRQLK